MAKTVVKLFIITTFIILSSLTTLATENFDLHSILKDLRGDNPKNTEKIDLKSFNCFDYPDLIEDGTCWCETEALLHSEKIRNKNKLIKELLLSCLNLPAL